MGVLYFFLYYVIFRVLIVKMNLHTLGREAEGMEMKLHSKSEYKAKVAARTAPLLPLLLTTPWTLLSSWRLWAARTTS